MAKIVIGGEVNIPVGEAEKGVKRLRLQLNDLRRELQMMDEADPAFLKMAKEAGALQDKIQAVDEQVKAFAGPANERNLQGIIGVTQGIAGGFAAAQGAAALFSGENEQLQKSMLKVQAAMALVMGLQEIQNTLKKESAAMTFLQATAEKVYAAAVGQSTGAMKKFRLALIATGLGALVVLVGAIVANWDKFKDAVLNLIPGLTKARDFVMGLVNGFTDLIGVTSEAERALDRYHEALAEGVTANKRYVQVLEAQGKDTFELRKKIMQDELQLLEVGSQEYLDKVVEYQVLIASADLKAEEERTKIQEEAQKKREGLQNKRDEEAKRKKQEADNLRIQKEKEINDIIAAARKELELGALDGQEKDLRALEMAYQEQVAVVEGNEEALKLLNAKYQQDKTAIQDQYAAQAREKRDKEYDENLAKKKAEDDKLLAEQKAYEDNLRDLRVNATLGIVSAIGEINSAFAGKSEQAARKAFNIQKALSMAETIVSTYSAAQRAYASTVPGPGFILRATAAAGIAIVGGLARLAAISKTKFESKTAEAPTTAGGDSAPQPQSSATNLAPDITRTRLGGGDSGEMTTRVIVVESDITNTQERVRRIDRRATVE